MSTNSERDLTSLCHRFAIIKATQNDTTWTKSSCIYAQVTHENLGEQKMCECLLSGRPRVQLPSGTRKAR